MIREKLIDAMKKQALGHGYTSYQGFAYRINSMVERYPSMWLEPPELTEKTGRNEGTITYKIGFKLMVGGTGKTESEKLDCWGAMESDALELVRSLTEQEFVLSIGGIKCEPGEYALTNHGELFCSVEFKIVVTYSDNR